MTDKTLTALTLFGIVVFLLVATFAPIKNGVLHSLNIAIPDTKAAVSVPALPKNWPFTTIQIGMANEVDDVSSMTKTAKFGLRYHYLTGGADSCQWCHWATWGTSNGTSHTGDYVNTYMKESVSQGMIPVFSYYTMLSYAGYSEGDGEVATLNNASKMNSYFNDLKLFMQLAHKYPNNPIMLQFEPDLWGYIENHTTSDDASTVPAQIGSSGMSDLSGLPNNASGFAQAVVKLRDLYAPNVLVDFHMSAWGTGTDFRYGSYTDAQITSAATHSANFFNSLHTNYDLLSNDPSDRDAGFYDKTQNNPNLFWDANDYHYDVLWISTVSQATGKRFIQWQIPYGNQQMRAENNTNNHYQDSHVEKLFGDSSRTLLNQYANAGVIAFLFGAGAGGQSNPSDSGDGVTNPAAITYQGVTNNIASELSASNTKPTLSSDGKTLTTPDAANDDGGYFRWKAAEYYATGALPLSGGTITPTTTTLPTATPTVAPTAVPTATPLPSATPGVTDCAITQAQWGTNQAVVHGAQVSLSVQGNGNCNAQPVTVQVYADYGMAGTQLVDKQPQKMILNATGGGQTNWIAESHTLFGQDALYYFIATPDNNSQSELGSADPELMVTPTQSTPSPTPTATPRPTIVPTATPIATPVSKGSTIVISAAGQSAAGVSPKMVLIINGSIVKTWSVNGNALSGLFETFTLTTATKITHDKVRVRFANDYYRPARGQDRNLRVDKITIDGLDYQSESASVYVKQSAGCPSGNLKTEWLYCNGYFQY